MNTAERPKYYESTRQTPTTNQRVSAGLDQWGSATRTLDDGRRKDYNRFHLDPPNMAAGRGFGDVDVMISMVPQSTRSDDPRNDPRSSAVDRFIPGVYNYAAYTNRIWEVPRNGVDTRFYNKSTTTQQKI